MQTVLYTDDMEPITVLDLSHKQLEFLQKVGRMRLMIPVSLKDVWVDPDNERNCAIDFQEHVVDIWIEPFQRNGARHWFLFTRQEEKAMRLRSTYLPGQRHRFEEDQRKAFARGVLAALSRLMPPGEDE